MRHDGMMRQFLTDDKGSVAILVWGCPPMSHLDNAARAARAAVELVASLARIVAQHRQRALKEASFKSSRSHSGASAASAAAATAAAAGEPPCPCRPDDIVAAGVTTGWAFAGNIGSANRAEFAVMGDVVNMAARIMGLAAKRGGGVACDLRTREFLLGRNDSPSDQGMELKLSSESLVAVKGKDAPISISDLSLAEHVPSDTTGGLLGIGLGSANVFVGRKQELAELSGHAMEHLGGAQKFTGVIINGRQGMGKVRGVPHFILRAACLQVGLLPFLRLTRGPLTRWAMVLASNSLTRSARVAYVTHHIT